jgi:dolichyl-phosphate beta-glucosyltransferase
MEFTLSFPIVVCSLLGLAILGLLVLYIGLLITTQRKPNLWRHESEQWFPTSTDDGKELFPSVDDPASVYLSLVVPAYNEKERCQL